jgi:hypothetical protein
MKTILISAAVATIALSFAGVRTFGGVARAGTAEQAQRVDVAPAPQLVKLGTEVGCADAVLCVGDCKKGDVSCISECEGAISKSGGSRLYTALMACAEEHACNGDGLCARTHCGGELNSCLAATAPEGGCR